MELPRKVYLIRHNVTGRIYIGSSKNVEIRYSNHMYNLRSWKHPVEDMQKDFDEYGENFTLTVIDEIRTYEEASKEYEWMREFKSHIRGVGYNYKDNAFKERPVPRKKETEKEKFIREINEEMQKTDDMDLLDLIQKLLEKSNNESRQAVAS